MRKLAAVVGDFNELPRPRPFTVDGHTLGSIGETIAAIQYDLELETPSSDYDAVRRSDGKSVEVKCTQSNSISLRGDRPKSVYLIVLKIDLNNGDWEPIYEGVALPAWERIGHKKLSNNQRKISFNQLRELPQGTW